jgi:hypothetical protein
MLVKFFIFFAIFTAAMLPLIHPVTAQPNPAKPSPVVVELFTSEGCSSCPPADELLGRLRQQVPGTEVIPLGFHVDYWNSLGWKDRFSSSAYTHRQEAYAERFHTEGPYTPQMVVNGEKQFVGNSSSEARQAIENASRESQPADVTLASAGSGRLVVRIRGAGAGLVMLAITEDNLETKVGRGENSGRTLHHQAVVRDFHQIGEVRDGKFEAGVPLRIDREWKRQDLRAVVFVQDPASGKITAAASLKPF